MLTPRSASLAMMRSDASPRYSNFEKPACSVPMIVAARQASKKSCSLLILEQLRIKLYYKNILKKENKNDTKPE